MKIEKRKTKDLTVVLVDNVFRASLTSGEGKELRINEMDEGKKYNAIVFSERVSRYYQGILPEKIVEISLMEPNKNAKIYVELGEQNGKRQEQK